MRARNILIGIIFLICIIGLLIFTSLLKKQSTLNPGLLPTPTPIPAQQQPQNAVQFNPTQTNKMIDTLKNRPSISSTDSNIKSNLINSVSNDSGTVYKDNTNNEFRIDYLKSPDMFQVEITTTDIQKAKADAVAWLQSQGMSLDGICKLPLTFYVNFDVKQQLQQKGQQIDFNPLPDGC